MVWPNSKHQLCFWHALKAVKKWLAKNKITPAHYNAIKANKSFSFIVKSFIPEHQLPLGQEVCFSELSNFQSWPEQTCRYQNLLKNPFTEFIFTSMDFLVQLHSRIQPKGMKVMKILLIKPKNIVQILIVKDILMMRS